MTDAELPLPPPPPVPPGAVPAIAPGYYKGLPPSRLNCEPSEGHSGHDEVAKVLIGSIDQASLALAPIPVPKKATRPGFGKLGRPSKLFVNHFKTSIMKWDDVYQYNVRTFSPPFFCGQCLSRFDLIQVLIFSCCIVLTWHSSIRF